MSFDCAEKMRKLFPVEALQFILHRSSFFGLAQRIKHAVRKRQRIIKYA